MYLKAKSHHDPGLAVSLIGLLEDTEGLTFAGGPVTTPCSIQQSMYIKEWGCMGQASNPKYNFPNK